MSSSDSPIFFNSALLYSDSSIRSIQNSTVAVAGIGGVGAIATEMIIRSGVGNIKLADPDIYELNNINRQLFATLNTLGKKKALVATARIREINPACKVSIFEDGVNLSNIYEFCDKVDVVLCTVDRESIKVILNRVAKELGIPVVLGSRSSIREHRWKVRSRILNYKKHPDLPCYDKQRHAELCDIPLSEFTEDFLRQFDEKIKQKKMNSLIQMARENAGLFGSINQDDLLERLSVINDFGNRDVNAVIANVGGCFVAAAALKIIIGGPELDNYSNLW